MPGAEIQAEVMRPATVTRTASLNPPFPIANPIFDNAIAFHSANGTFHWMRSVASHWLACCAMTNNACPHGFFWGCKMRTSGTVKL